MLATLLSPRAPTGCQAPDPRCPPPDGTPYIGTGTQGRPWWSGFFPSGPPPNRSLLLRPDSRSLLILSPALCTPPPPTRPKPWPGFLEFVLLIETKHRGSSGLCPQRPWWVSLSLPPPFLSWGRGAQPRAASGGRHFPCTASGGRHFPCTGCGVGPSLLLGSELNSALSQAGGGGRRRRE